MAKKKLYSFREWQQLMKARKEAAAERRKVARQAKMEAWWAMPAQRNFVQLIASRRLDTPGEVHISGTVFPDKRRLEHNSLAIHLTVNGDVDQRLVVAQLLALAQTVAESNAMWDLAARPPLTRPVDFEGHPPQTHPRGYWSQTYEPATAPSPAPAVDQNVDLAALRRSCEMWLDRERQDETSPFLAFTLEEYCEILVLLACGQDIVLLTDRDPWRWEHTEEEVRTVAEHAVALEQRQTLEAIIARLHRDRSPEAVIELLLTVFVEGW